MQAGSLRLWPVSPHVVLPDIPFISIALVCANPYDSIVGTVDPAIEGQALAVVKVLSGLGVVRAAYLFGSHVEGTPDEWSDIDVAVFMEGVEHWDIDQRAEATALVMEKVGSEVEAHLFPVSDLDNPPRGGFAKYILHHGIRIFKQE